MSGVGLYRACGMSRFMYSNELLYRAYRVLRFLYSDGRLHRSIGDIFYF